LGLDIVATVDASGDTDLVGLVSIVSDVLTISQSRIQILGDSSGRGSPSVQTSVDNILIVLVDDDKLTMVGEGHG
jgi:hypothetical protein